MHSETQVLDGNDGAGTGTTESGRQNDTPESTAGGETEFRVTIRKLDMPVRPRGVLAE